MRACSSPVADARMERLVEVLRSLPVPGPTTSDLARCTGVTTPAALKMLQHLERSGTVACIATSGAGRLTYRWRLR